MKLKATLKVPPTKFAWIVDQSKTLPAAKKAAVIKSLPDPVTPPNTKVVTIAEGIAVATLTTAQAIIVVKMLLKNLNRENKPTNNALVIATKANGIAVGISIPLIIFPNKAITMPTHGPAIIDTKQVPT